MDALTDLEQSVLEAIARQVPEVAEQLRGQSRRARLIARENTGAGFYTTFCVPQEAPRLKVNSPMGDVGANIDGLEHGMGFLLWLKDGRIHQLEGYAYDESTIGIDFGQVAFSEVGPRVRG